ncbi:MAG: glycosyl hydrolase-related protein, partial [Bacteroidota bacterium]
PLSHLDIGFTATQEEVFAQYKEYFDKVLAYCDEDPEFTYTVETAWQYLAWERQTCDPSLVRRFMDRVREGRISFGAAFASMHTGMLGMEELHRVFYHTGELQRRWNIPIHTAWMNDVPGYNWALPRTLAGAGIRYFVTGVNVSLGGGADLPPTALPFYWAGPDGSRVLTWVSHRNYLEAWEQYRLADDDDEAMEAGIRKLLGEWETVGYPYDAVLAIGAAGDNLGPDLARAFVRRAREWNARHDDVKIVVGTAEQFFHHMETKYAGRFPVLSGDWNGLWEFARGANSAGTAITRKARFFLPAAEAFAALETAHWGSSYPRESLGRAYEALLTYDEHSAGNGTGWPGLLTRRQVVAHNAISYGYARRTHDLTEELVQRAVQVLAAQVETNGVTETADTRGILVVNGLPWPRSGSVEVRLEGDAAAGYCAASTEGDSRVVRFTDGATGDEIDAEVLPGGVLRLAARSVPPLGWRCYRGLGCVAPRHTEQANLESVTGGGPGEATVMPRPDGVALENEYYLVELTTDGRIERILDKRADREIIAAAAGFKWNELVAGAGMDGKPEPMPSGASRLGVSGPHSLCIRRDGTAHTATEITLRPGEERIEFHHEIDLSYLAGDPAVRARWHYLIFPFAFEPGNFDFVYDTAAGLVSPFRDMLPGASRSAWAVQSVLALQDEDRWGVAVAQRESFLWSTVPFRRYAPGEPRRPLLAAALFTYNSRGVTKDEGEVRFELDELEPACSPRRFFSYALTSWTGACDPVRTLRFGYEWNQPLVATLLPVNGGSPILTAEEHRRLGAAGSLLWVSPNNVVVTAVKLPESSPEGASQQLIVRLQEIAGQPETQAVLELNGLPVIQAVLCDVLERPYQIAAGMPIPTNPIRLRLGPREVVTMLLSVGSS